MKTTRSFRLRPGLGLLCLLAALAAPHAARAQEKEYILLSGGPTLNIWEKWKAEPHDLWWQNFIQAAELRIGELERKGVPGRSIAWLVYRPSYETRGRQDGQDYCGQIAARARAAGVRLQFFRTKGEVVNYLNAGQPRAQVKIADLEYFGHSNKACWMFDYSNVIDSASKVWLHEDELSLLAPGAFTRDAFVKSWGCHTGESMSQKFRDRTGVRMWGAVGRTQYMTHELPALAQPGDKWKY